MKIDFNDLPVGPYTEQLLESQWPGVRLSRGVADGRCRVVEFEGEHVLQVTHVKGKVGPVDGGVSWRYRFEEPLEEVTAEYKVRVEKGFDFVRGGKLPGLCGGTSPGGGASTQEADGFSARVMWRELGVLESYVYHMDRNLGKRWGTDYLWFSSANRGESMSDADWDSLHERRQNRIYFTPDMWHTIKSQVRMNTPGEQDGNITVWLDGNEVLNMAMRFRKDDSFSIDSFRFTTFFGGNDITWAPKKDQSMFFKEFIFT